MKSINLVTLFILFLLTRKSQTADTDDQEEKKNELLKPYKFGYEIKDEKGNVQHRHEQSDGKMQTGSYGYLDANGIFRKVVYIADKDGFRARLDSYPGIQSADKTNESNEKLINELKNSSSPLSEKEINVDDNSIDVGKSSSNRYYTNVPQNIVNSTTVAQQYMPREVNIANDTKRWIDSSLNRIKNEEPIFTNEKVYMQLIPETRLELEHKTPSKLELIQLSNLQPNSSIQNSTWQTDQNYADSLNTANSRNFPFKYQNPPQNRKYEQPFRTNSNNHKESANYLDNEAVVNDYPKQKKKVYFTANQNSNYQNDVPRRSNTPIQQPAIIHNPNQRFSNLVKPSKNDLNNNNYLANYTTNRNNGRDYVIVNNNNNNNNNYKQLPTKLEYERIRTSPKQQQQQKHLPATSIPQQNQPNKPKEREFYVKPSNIFYETDPDPPIVEYNKPATASVQTKPIYSKPPVATNLVQSEPVYVKDKPLIKKQHKIPLYSLDQSQDSYSIRPKQYSNNNKPQYPPYEYHFNMPVNKQQSADYQLPKNERYNSRLQSEEEYAPPLPSPKPYETNTQGRSIDSASTNPESVKPTYLTGFTPVIAENKYSRPLVEDYPPQSLPKPIYKLNKHQLQQQPKYNIQLLNSGLISINELDNQIDRNKISNYPNLAYNRQAATNKLEHQHYAYPNDVDRSNYENIIYPENKAYTYPTTASKPIGNQAGNAYLATPSNEDEIMYEKYKSMIRSRLPPKNLAYRPYERLTASPNYSYNVSNNNPNENELTPYNPLPNHHRNNQLNSHSTNHESYGSPPFNNSHHPNDIYFTPNQPKEATPLFFSKYNLPEHNNNKPPILNNINDDQNDPDLYNPEGAVRYEIKRYLGKNLKNRRYFKPHSKLTYPTNLSGNYEIIRPNRFNNGLIPAKEDNLIDRSPNNRLNLIEHNYLHNYVTSASNPTINKFKYNLKSLLPKMEKSGALPYGGINIDELENQKNKLSVQKIYIKDTLHHQQKNPREIRELKYNPNAEENNPNLHDQLIQLEALAREDDKENRNEVNYQPINNKTKVIFTRPDFDKKDFNQTNQLRQIDIPISLQEASTVYGSRIDNKNLTNNDYLSSSDQSNNRTSLSNKRGYKIKKMFVNRGSLVNKLNETEMEERKSFKFIHVPSSIIETKKLKKIDDNLEDYRDEYKNENYSKDKQDETLESMNTIDQSKSNIKNIKYEDNNLIELANQKQLVKMFPLPSINRITNLNDDNLNSESSNQLSTQLNTTNLSLTNHSSSSSTSTTASIK